MKRIIKYFSPQIEQTLFEKQKTNAFITIAFVGFSLSIFFIIQSFLQKTNNFHLSISSIVIINSFTILNLFLLRKKGIKFVGNLFSLGAVIGILIILNILSPKIPAVYKYFQGFYTIFAFIGISILFASKRIIVINAILILISTTHVYLFALNQIPNFYNLLTVGYVSNTLSIILLSLNIFFAIKFTENTINTVNLNLKIKERQNKKLKKAQKRIEKSKTKLVLKNQELEASEEEIRAAYEEIRATNYALNESYKELEISKSKAEESDNLKTEFIQNLSHEIRTPMNGIIGFSSFLEKPNLTVEQKTKYIDIIKSSSYQLLRIIDDILEISILGTKQEKVIEKEVSLNELFTELFLIFEIKAKQQKIDLKVVKSLSDKESIIITDKSKLHKILSNLIDNSLKFTKEGYIKFGYNKENNKIIIFVEDTGIGINPKNHEIIFKKFSQEEKEISQKAGGLGLGLVIVKENIKLLNGEVYLESIKGKGTTFFITIPCKHPK